MDYSQKVEVVPIKNEAVTSTQVSTKTFNKLFRQIKLILKLAKVNAYDINGRIRNEDGSFLDNSDITHLISYAMSPGTVRKGEDTFIKLLYQANVEPELLYNNNLKAKLQELYNSNMGKKNEEIYYSKPIQDNMMLKRKIEDAPIVTEIKEDLSEPNLIIDENANEDIDNIRGVKRTFEEMPLEKNGEDDERPSKRRNWELPAE